MALAVSQIVEGVVASIVKFGVFIDLEENKSGLVHISEISDSYVKNIDEFLQKGQKVKVKVLSLNNGKIELSIKKAKSNIDKKVPVEIEFKNNDKELSFEDKLSKFMKESSEKLEQYKAKNNYKTSGYRSKNKK